MEPAIESRGKRSSSHGKHYSKCLVCQTVSDANGPIHKLTKLGLDTFRNAVQRWRDDVYQRIWEDIQDDDLFLAKKPVCHQDCRAVYTLKRLLDALEPTTSKRLKDEGETTRPSRQSIDYKTVCFLCEKEQDSKRERKLTLISTETRQKAVYKKAKELQDETVLRKIEGFGEDCIDFVANNFRYHTKCMGKFIKTHSKCGSENSPVSEHDSMFQKLVSEISEGLLINKHAY